MTPQPSLVLVGHCGADTWSMQRAFGSIAADEGYTLNTAHDDAELSSYARPGCIWLVNRVLDGAFDAADGIDLIRTAASKPHPPTLMLVSNYPDSQLEAQAGGALPGFGKSQLNHPATHDRIRHAIARSREALAALQ